MMKDKISQRLKRVSIKSIVWSHWNEGSRFQIKSRQCYQIYRPSNPLWSFLFFFFVFWLQFLFDFFIWLYIYLLPFVLGSYTLISLSFHTLGVPFMSVASATPAVCPFCSAQCWRNFKKQPKNRTSHLSEICSVCRWWRRSLFSSFFLACPFHDGPLLRKIRPAPEGKISEEETAAIWKCSKLT
jgi:hypothetical protein